MKKLFAAALLLTACATTPQAPPPGRAVTVFGTSSTPVLYVDRLPGGRFKVTVLDGSKVDVEAPDQRLQAAEALLHEASGL